MLRKFVWELIENDKQYYYDRPRAIGDYHGQAPYLWCAAALLEK